MSDHVGLHDKCRFWVIGTDIEDHHVPPTKVEHGWQYPVVGQVTGYTEVGSHLYDIEFAMSDGTTGKAQAWGTGRTTIEVAS